MDTMNTSEEFARIDLGDINIQVPTKVPENVTPHIEEHTQVGDYLKSAVYGGLDGTINVLVVILSGIASGTFASKIMSIGISVMLGDGLSMGLGDYLSVKAEKGFIESEYEREKDEVINKREAEIMEIVDIYEEKGYTSEQSERIAELYATNSQAFVNIMMLEELGLVVNDSSAIICGLTTFFSFTIFAFIPLIPYIISTGIIKSDSQQLIACIVIGIVQFFSLGFFKAVLLDLPKIISGLEILIGGSAVVAISYGIGVGLHVGAE